MEKYFDLSIPNERLYGNNKTVLRGEHGVTINQNGEHFATYFHIQKQLAKEPMLNFLKQIAPDGKALSNLYSSEQSIHTEIPLVEYVGDGYDIKKYKLEWLVDLFERRTIQKNVEERTIELGMIEKYVLEKLESIIKMNGDFFDDLEKAYVLNVVDLIRKCPEHFEMLVQAYFLSILEFVFRKVEKTDTALQHDFQGWLRTERRYKEHKDKWVYQLSDILDYSYHLEYLSIDHKKFLDGLRRNRNNILHSGVTTGKDLTVAITMAEKTVNLLGKILAK